MTLTHRFVEQLPSKLERDVLYVSIRFATVAHSCCCGCGHEVVTPLSPTDWQLTFDGETVSLTPSVGNWSFDCQSHYWIRRNVVKWAEQMSQDEIRAVRYRDEADKAYLATPRAAHHLELDVAPRRNSPWRRIGAWLKG
jgi:hypothetical protein